MGFVDLRLPSGETFCLGIQLHFELSCISLHFRPGKLLCAKQCFVLFLGGSFAQFLLYLPWYEISLP